MPKIITLSLERTAFGEQHTGGILSLLNPESGKDRLFSFGKFLCHTLEDKVMEEPPGSWTSELKLKGESAIPYGMYDLIVSHSPRLGRELPLIMSVPDFLGIRIHSGVSEKSSAGCVLVGYKRAGNRLDKEASGVCEKDVVRILKGFSKEDYKFKIHITKSPDAKWE